MNTAGQFNADVASGARFEFGENWSRFLRTLNEDRIQVAEESLVEMLGLGAGGLSNRSFLDIGSGSGLFSLAARRLGARVYSFDYDSQSVACTQELRNRYFPDDSDWQVEQGSVLDLDYLQSLGIFDYVYSWGVLHHTGQMWQALENVARAVADDGFLFIAIYNDQGWKSKFWLWVKKTFNRLPTWLRTPYVIVVRIPFEMRIFIYHARRSGPLGYFKAWRNYGSQRGMSRWTDMVDWVGGYPYEVARPQEITEFYQSRSFVLVKQFLRDGSGCNEFVLRKSAPPVSGKQE